MSESTCASLIARLEERLVAQDKLRKHDREGASEALRIAREEIARRLEHLNGEAARISAIHRDMVPRELFEMLGKRVAALEGDAREMRGKLWLPMIAAAAIAAGLAVAVVRVLG